MKDKKKERRPLMVAWLSGSESAMGAELGGMVREVGGWEEALDYYPHLLEKVLATHSAWGRRFLRPLVAWALRRLDKVSLPEVKERELAFMRGIGLSARHARYYHIFDVLQNVVSMIGRARLGPFKRKSIPLAAAGFCSSLVAWGKATDDGTLRHARNFDLPGAGIFERYPIVVFCNPPQGINYGYVSIRGADICSVNAFNQAGISISTHNRFHLRATWNGLPIHDFIYAIISQARTIAEALEIARRIGPPASTYGIAISSASERKAVSLETCADKLRIVEPGAEETFLAVTNHYIDPRMREEEISFSPAQRYNSLGRYEILREQAALGQLSLERIQHLLAGHLEAGGEGHVRATGNVVAQVHNVQSVVFEPEKERLHVSVGAAPTCEGPWATIPWRWPGSSGYELYSFEKEELPTTIDPAFASPQRREGLEALYAASAIHWRDGDRVRSRAWMEKAVAADPTEPSYRLLLGGGYLQQRRWRDALEQFESGLELEHNRFYRGLLHFWAFRSAQRLKESAGAAKHLSSLRRNDHPLLHNILHDAAQEAQNPIRPGKLANIMVQYHLCALL